MTPDELIVLAGKRLSLAQQAGGGRVLADDGRTRNWAPASPLTTFTTSCAWHSRRPPRHRSGPWACT